MKHIEDVCEEKARAGDGSFAIAFALLQIARHQDRLATMVGRLGFDCMEHPGGLEGITMELAKISSALDPLNVSASVTAEIQK